MSTNNYVNLATKAYKQYSGHLEAAINITKRMFSGLGSVEGRAKTPSSAANRLERAVKQFGATVGSDCDVIKNLWDALGTRLVLNDASSEAMHELVRHLHHQIALGDSIGATITQINSLTGPGGYPYFTQDQLIALVEASEDAGYPEPIVTDFKGGYETGYTVVAVYVRYPNAICSLGFGGEIQIIGRETLRIANAEHFVYDAFLKKPYEGAFNPKHLSQAQRLIEPLRRSAQGLNDDLRKIYNGYLNQCYQNARLTEMRQPTMTVQLPTSIPKILSVENLISVDRTTKPWKNN